MDWLLIVGGIVLYFVPTGIAYARNHHNCVPILLLNLFLGWSVLGWFVALIWSLMSPAVAAVSSGGRKCPFCAETIQAAAVVCRYCGRDLAHPAPATDQPATPSGERLAPGQLFAPLPDDNPPRRH